MAVDFLNSKTKENLMRAFAGESQARNRYTIGASQAKSMQLNVVERAFTFTADQEKEHAVIFYRLLTQAAGENILVDGKYPVDITTDMATLLKMAHHNEMEEHSVIYPDFARIAREEGFAAVGDAFANIAAIEKTHADRFQRYAQLVENKTLFAAPVEEAWLCLNCGHIHYGKEAPLVCPVCQHAQGYFIRTSFAPFRE